MTDDPNRANWPDRHPHLWPLLIAFPGSLLAGIVGSLAPGAGGLTLITTFFSGWHRFVNSFPNRRVRAGIAAILVSASLLAIIFSIVVVHKATHCGRGRHAAGMSNGFVCVRDTP